MTVNNNSELILNLEKNHLQRFILKDLIVRDKVLFGILSKSTEIISSSLSPAPEVLSPK
jgi:hypothetical protein